uniref:Uncharacterized protein n=1 Tax=Siphoviridae sp. ctZgu8 TaxID=2827893 RepID=A0A8S5SKW8_9CAUD|nr:MAG TPA: hypothetical protein [Siphoviridae sp. ctZgu8]DAO23957.1 MAG TPA: hypothetical protein [Caudoviricetes sp.]
MGAATARRIRPVNWACRWRRCARSSARVTVGRNRHARSSSLNRRCSRNELKYQIKKRNPPHEAEGMSASNQFSRCGGIS